jgi:hypothetical protein
MKTRSSILRIELIGLTVGLVTLLIVGCKEVQYVPVKSMNIETVTLRDTVVKTILVPYFDTVYIQKDTVSHLKNQYAESWARWIGGGLSHSLHIFPDSISVRVVYKDVEKIKETEIPIEVERKLSKWESFKMDVGGWAIGLLSGVFLLGIGYLIIWLIGKKNKV